MPESGRLVALALVTAVTLAGCLSPDETTTPAAADSDSGRPVERDLLTELAPSATGCREGGGHSVHPKSLWEKGLVRVVPDPWVPADVIDDVGPQVTYSEIPDPEHPVPEKGNTMGNYHATVFCDSWTIGGEARPGVVFGFVGMKVERPEWSDDAPTHHYVVTVVATNDEDLHAALTAGGVHAMRATATWETLPGDALRIRMSTDHNGDYDSILKTKPHGEMSATHVRLWFQSEHAGAYRPVALDLHSEGGEHRVAEAQGYFSHVGTHHHQPSPGAYGHTAGIVYTGFDRTLAWGPPTDVRLSQAYDH